MHLSTKLLSVGTVATIGKLGITVSTDRSFDGPGSSESRRLKESARARRRLNAAVCRKLENHLISEVEVGDGQNGDNVDGIDDDDEESAKVRRQRYKDQRQFEEGPDISSWLKNAAEDIENDQNGRIVINGEGECLLEGNDNAAASESDGESDEEEEAEEEEELIVESVSEFFERLVRETEEEQRVVNHRDVTTGKMNGDSGESDGDQLVAAVRRTERQLTSGCRNSYIDCGSNDQIDGLVEGVGEGGRRVDNEMGENSEEREVVTGKVRGLWEVHIH